MNLFATALTYTAPSANYRGESEMNRAVIQRVTVGRFEYPIISPEAIRNALREELNAFGLPCNRERLDDEDQLAVKFRDYPWPEKYADDFFFGYMVAHRNQVKLEKLNGRKFQFKRDSIFRMNLALALEPYRHDALFTQSPLTKESPWQNATTSALLHRETSVNAFQYPFAINVADCHLDRADPLTPDEVSPGGHTYASQGERNKDWLCYLLRAVAELNDVAGNHARSYFEMAPASIVLRVSDSLVAGYDLYAFQPDGSLPEVVQGILAGDYPGNEFLLGGQIVREKLSDTERAGLRAKGTRCYRMASHALDSVARQATGRGFLSQPAVEV